MTNNLGEIPAEPPRRERPRIVKPLVLFAGLCVLALVIVQLVFNSTSQRLARASRDFDRIAAMRPRYSSVLREIFGAKLEPVSGHRARAWDGVRTIPVQLPMSHWRLYHSVPMWHPSAESPKVGELYFSGDAFNGAKNFITGVTYAVAETTASR